MFYAIAHHVFLVMTLRHDGKGLPTRPSSAFFTIVGVAFLVSLARNLVSSEFAWMMFFVAQVAMIGTMIYLANNKRPKLAGVILMTTIGTDVIGLGFNLAGLPSPTAFLLVWSIVAIVKNRVVEPT